MTTLLQDQVTAANQGKPGFDVLGNSLKAPQIGDAQVVANQQAAAKMGVSIPGVGGGDSTKSITPTTISGDKSQQISDNTQQVNNIQNTPRGNSTGADTFERYSNGDWANAPSDAVPVSDENGRTVWQSGGRSYYLAPDTAEYQNPADKQSMDLLNQVKTQTDSAFAGQISAVKDQFEQLIKQQQDTNTRQKASVDQTLLMGGTSRYAQVNAAGIDTAQINYGIQKISDLQNKENSAVADLISAQASKDYEIVGKQLDQIQKIKDEKQKTVNDLNTKLEQANKDARAAKIAADKVVYDTVTKPIQDIALEAKKNGASDSIIKAINSATDVQSAISSAGGSLQTGTGILGDYLQYKRDTESQGLKPKDYVTFKDEQDKKSAQNDINKAVAIHNAERVSDANYTASDKVQQKLEQQYRGVLSKEFSSRTGSLGVENSKVNQANHLNSLVTQYYDPKTDTYNVPKAQYAELAIGLANLISPTGTVTEGAREAIMQKTAAGDINGALSYITGTPIKGTTDAVIKNLVDSIDRQAQTASENRGTALQNLRDQAPTDLEQSRVDKLNKSTNMVEYAGQERISKKNVDNFLNTSGSQTVQMSDGPHSMYYAVAQLFDTPGATNKDVEEYLRANGYIQ